MGSKIAASASPSDVIVGRADRALTFADHLLRHGILAPAIRPPTVPEATSRIRITVTSEHTTDQIEEALLAFRRAGESARVL